MRNLLLKIQYDGSLYHGWARQPGLRTVCGRMEEVLSEYFSVPVELAGASRTDAGVHASPRPERAGSRPERPVSAPRKADRPQPDPER